MSEAAIEIRTEVYGLELHLSASQLVVAAGGQSLTAPIVLSSDDAARLRIEMAKAQLWEWNQLESLKAKADKRYRNYLGSWLVLCLAAFSAYIGYPGYYPPLFLCGLSIFIWWRAGYEEQKADKAAQAERSRFVPEWSYFQQRAEESQTTLST
jgi:hypothetical protein